MTSPNRNTVIRFLAISSLLIFFLPFFQMCSDKNIRENQFLKSYSNAKTKKEKEIAFEKSKRDFSLSGYELAISFEPEFLSFTAIMFLNFTICISVLRNHKQLLLLSFLNLVIILFSFFLLLFTLPHFGQIRYGMYLCVVNALLLFYFIYKEQETAFTKN